MCSSVSKSVTPSIPLYPAHFDHNYHMKFSECYVMKYETYDYYMRLENNVKNQFSIEEIERLFWEAHANNETISQAILLNLYLYKIPKNRETIQKAINLSNKFLSQDFKIRQQCVVFNELVKKANPSTLVTMNFTNDNSFDSKDFEVLLFSLLAKWEHLSSCEFGYMNFDPIIAIIEKINKPNSRDCCVSFSSTALEGAKSWASIYNSGAKDEAREICDASQAIKRSDYKTAYAIYKKYNICNNYKTELAEIAVLGNLYTEYQNEIEKNLIQSHREIAKAAIKLKRFDVYTEHALALFELKNYEHNYYLGALAHRFELNQPVDTDKSLPDTLKDRLKSNTSEEYWRLGTQTQSDFQSQCQVAYGRVLWRKNEQEQAMEQWRAAARNNNRIAEYYLRLLSFDSRSRRLASSPEEFDWGQNHLKTFFDKKEENDSAYLNKSFWERTKIWIGQHSYKDSINVMGKVASLAAKYFLLIGSCVLLGAGGLAFVVSAPLFGFSVAVAMTVLVAGVGSSIPIIAGTNYFTRLFDLSYQYNTIFGDPKQRWFPEQ